MTLHDAKRLKLSSDMDNSHKIVSVEPKSGNLIVKCTLCNKNCDTETQFEIHQNSKAHLKKLAFNEKTCSTISSSTAEIINSEYFCKICNVNCNTQQQLEKHNNGKSHHKKSMKNTYQDFSSLNITNFNSEISSSNKDNSSIDIHNMTPEISSSNSSFIEQNSENYVNDQVKNDNSQIAESPMKLSEVDPVIMALLKPIREENKITCRLCNNSTNTEEQYQMHCRGSKHIKRLKSYRVPTDLMDLTIGKEMDIDLERCEICNISIHKNNMESHNKGKLHKEKLIKSTVMECSNVLVKDVKKTNLLPNLQNSLKPEPRKYQQEIYEKALKCDCVVFLPTGTGKTMIAAMLILKMLEENPHHRVVFVVDKVLLVMQQHNYLNGMFKDVITERFISSTETANRQIKLIAMANELNTTEHNCSIRDHDVIVATAELFRNCLKGNQVKWSDLSLVILDEAHHCVKEHPYNKLLSEYHLYPTHVLLAATNKSNAHSITDQLSMKPEVDQKKMAEWKEKRCKVIGLTASPAGDIDEDNTYKLLELLLESLGGVDIVSVTDNIEELNDYTSLTQIETKMINYTPRELRFRNLISQNFVFLLHKFEREIDRIGKSVIVSENHPLSIDVVSNLKNQLCTLLSDMENHHKSIVNHIISLVRIIEDIDSIGFQIALNKFQEILNNDNDKVWFENNIFLFKANTDKFMNEKSSPEDELDTSSIVTTIVEQARELGENNRTVLVLVKERQVADSLKTALKLKITNDFGVVKLVGHGTKGAKNKQTGMSVIEQKKALDFIREKRSQIIVATSVADEGIDLPECDLVIIINPPNSVQALVQIRGRARKKTSRLLMLCRDQESIDELEKLKLQEANIVKAINKMSTNR